MLIRKVQKSRAVQLRHENWKGYKIYKPHSGLLVIVDVLD